MKITKPSWMHHKNEKGKKQCIYSVSIDRLGKRIATGSLDCKIKVWNLDSIYDEESNHNEIKLLSVLSRHEGAVLCLDFDNNKDFLASGSDDYLLLIWQLVKINKEKEEGKAELWKPIHRLNKHTSDVTDVKYSKDGRFLSSCSLDNTINIWDTLNYKLIKRLKHDNFVKGITIDPNSEYIASQSDDMSLIIWDIYSNEEMVRKIEKPFIQTQPNTFFKKPSWSPDGELIVTANAMNDKRNVSALLDKKKDWESSLSLIGHKAPITVTSFCPNLLKNSSKDEYYSICCVGGQDMYLSFWDCTNMQPLAVIKNVYKNSIMDITWSPVSALSASCSSDGSVLLVEFDSQDVGHLLTNQQKEEIIQRKHPRKHSKAINMYSQTSAQTTPEVENKAQETISIKNGKKRIRPTPVPAEHSLLSVHLQEDVSKTNTNGYEIKKEIVVNSGEYKTIIRNNAKFNKCIIAHFVNNTRLFEEEFEMLVSHVHTPYPNSDVCVIEFDSQHIYLLAFALNNPFVNQLTKLSSNIHLLMYRKNHLVIVTKALLLYIWHIDVTSSTARFVLKDSVCEIAGDVSDISDLLLVVNSSVVPIPIFILTSSHYAYMYCVKSKRFIIVYEKQQTVINSPLMSDEETEFYQKIHEATPSKQDQRLETTIKYELIISELFENQIRFKHIYCLMINEILKQTTTNNNHLLKANINELINNSANMSQFKSNLRTDLFKLWKASLEKYNCFDDLIKYLNTYT